MTEVIVELSGNHGGVLGNALRLIEAAKKAGGGAVKFQCFQPARLALKRNRPDVLALAGGVPLIELYRQIWTPWDWFPTLIEHCKTVDIPWFSSVFSPEDVAFLETLDCPRYKISAFEMLDWELIKAVTETGKPIVMSVRPTDRVTLMQASNYDGTMPALGISSHNYKPVPAGVPMVEWHLKLPDVNTPDSEFSLTSEQLRENIAQLCAPIARTSC